MAAADITLWQIGLGVLALIGVIALLLLALLVIDEWWSDRGARFGFDPEPVDRGTPILDYINEEVVRSLAKHHHVDTGPAKIERQRKRGFGLNLKILKGNRESGATETNLPYDDRAEVLRLLLRHLDGEGELGQDVDCVYAPVLEYRQPLFAVGEEEASQQLEQRLAEHYPDGLGEISVEKLAAQLAASATDSSDVRVVEHMLEKFRALQDGDEQILFMEGEWAIEPAGEEGLRLSRTDLRILQAERYRSGSLPIPEGLGIEATLSTESLTSHGRNRMVGVTQPVRASVVGTLRQFEDGSGRLELAPVAVFQRIS
jgi:hypothetical protein